KDVFLHLGIPAPRLVTEMNSGLQQFLHGDFYRHCSSFLDSCLRWPRKRPRSYRGRHKTTEQPFVPTFGTVISGQPLSLLPWSSLLGRNKTRDTEIFSSRGD